MKFSGTFPRAHIIDTVAEKNGFNRQKSIKTVKIAHFVQRAAISHFPLTVLQPISVAKTRLTASNKSKRDPYQCLRQSRY